MRDLIARIEAATGPDREIDAAIAAAAGTAVKRDWDAAWSPAYSTSLDAAVSLVPDGWAWTLYSAEHDCIPTAYCVPNMKRIPWPKIEESHAATPALALCAAALRARIAMQEAAHG